MENNEAYIAGLLDELRGYEFNRNAEGIAAVEAELKRVGHVLPAAPKKRETAAVKTVKETR
jgi:hypothetical protein